MEKVRFLCSAGLIIFKISDRPRLRDATKVKLIAEITFYITKPLLTSYQPGATLRFM